jgi:hypothetical protein
VDPELQLKNPELQLKNSLLGMQPETCHQQLVNDHEYRYTADALPPQILSHQSTRFNAKPFHTMNRIK